MAAALAAALCWTVASGLWRRLPTSLTGPQLNLLKNLLALALQLPIGLLLFQPIAAPAIGVLLLSGVLGIAAGDSLYFAALRRLGTRRTLTLEAGAPALTALAGAALLAEVPTLRQGMGIALVSGAVLLVARQKAPCGAGSLAGAAEQRLGVVVGLAALVCSSAGALLARFALGLAPVSPLQAATIRLGAAALVLLPLLPGLPRAVGAPLGGQGPRPSLRRWPLVLAATLLGTTAGIVLQQTALALLQGSLAVTLLATAPVMAVVLAPLDGDRPGLMGLVAAVLALLGVVLVAW